MSLIEEAARRLEQLRRAPAPSCPTGLPTKASRCGGQRSVPTPEAMIQAIEAQGRSRQPSHRSAAQGSDRRNGRGSRPDDALRRASGRFVEIDLVRLRTQGFVTPDAPTSRIADEFRVIKRPIIKNALGQGDERVRHGNLLMVTSSLPGEGKTFTAINLAMSIAMEYDSRVLLVDGDVAHPSMPGMLGTPHSPGLLDLLTRDEIDVGDALVRTNVEGSRCCPQGRGSGARPSSSRASRWQACCASSRRATRTASSSSIRHRFWRLPRLASSRRTWVRS